MKSLDKKNHLQPEHGDKRLSKKLYSGKSDRAVINGSGKSHSAAKPRSRHPALKLSRHPQLRAAQSPFSLALPQKTRTHPNDSTRCPIKEFFESPAAVVCNNGRQQQFVSYQVRKPKGQITFSYKFVEKVGGFAAKIDEELVVGPNFAYPPPSLGVYPHFLVDQATRQYPSHVAPGVYPPPPLGEYPSLPRYGYPPLPSYGGYPSPPLPSGYGYPPQPEYGYPGAQQ
ncbi:Uncharacterized protein Fot_10873 [Forsythia ovata]|uniref:Uncharacterized protein n=1 Tax=Forsythia ovata TaxID=205694 RepID=A0ABD1WI35_9LAMI